MRVLKILLMTTFLTACVSAPSFAEDESIGVMAGAAAMVGTAVIAAGAASMSGR